MNLYFDTKLYFEYWRFLILDIFDIVYTLILRFYKLEIDIEHLQYQVKHSIKVYWDI